ncbi:hypothetical protein [Sinimarinibacterium flocculans]|uniref:hypothetical protein n=1 Tax=Sinimarinibacterium flocculans TaxID=985250 RepID=UPI002492F93A|nr:hypothetical protein [Sinimarinibacterium flocculans]
MSKHSVKKFTNGSGRNPARAPLSLPERDAPAHDVPPRASDPRETAQEAVHQVMTKDAARAIAAEADATKPPQSAAQGDDDLMSKPAKRS